MTAQSKTRILETTTQCLAELGYAGTTMSEIADRVGLTRAALIYHFSSKHELMVAVMNALYDEMTARFSAAAPSSYAQGTATCRDRYDGQPRVIAKSDGLD
jgi:AcrR family transcriptional regulator